MIIRIGMMTSFEITIILINDHLSFDCCHVIGEIQQWFYHKFIIYSNLFEQDKFFVINPMRNSLLFSIGLSV